ncbi:MAG TPA: hypothetical protein VHQ00_15045 [Chloroflexota bacterium]|nr:hypothetical protein [Chloroflexota bacterium]
MSTRFTVTISCDDARSPECVGTHSETRLSLGGFEGIAVRLLQVGWDWDLNRRDEWGHSHDACPACVEWAQAHARPSRSEPTGPAQAGA